MKTVETTGRTIEEALQAAQAELGLEEKEDIDFEVLEEPNKGFLGLLGGRPARIKAWVKETPVVKACAFVETILQKMGIAGKIETAEEDGYLQINIIGDDLGILIGRRGKTLDALQYLTNLATNHRSKEQVKVIVDVAGYRERRMETLRNLAKRLIQKVKTQRQSVVLEPMTPQERRIIHLTVQEEKGVISYSEGEEPFRKVIIGLDK
ncbi:MAG: RNA-binding cell elongation regulator Jag/EloR [bacterium]|jgi:spoIIIJ-associated protein